MVKSLDPIRARLWRCASLLLFAIAAACGPESRAAPERSVVAELRRSHPELASGLEQALSSPVRPAGASRPAGFRIQRMKASAPDVPPPAAAALALVRRTQHREIVAELPETAAAPMQLAVARSDYTVRVRRRGATSAPAELDAGALVYRNAIPGLDAVVFARGDSVEELWRVRALAGELAYDLELPAGARLRAVAPDRVELLDARGNARMRLTAKSAWDARGRTLSPELEVSASTIRVRIDPDAALPVVIDPEWESTAALSIIREHGSATLLPSGRVLLAGGTAATQGYVSSAEIYDPTSGTFSATGDIQKSRIYHTATLLPSGKVLITGGASPQGGVHAVSEIYDEQTGTFTLTGSMATARSDHTATLLVSGKVLVAGGTGPAGGPFASSELYDPQSGAFSAGPPLSAARYGHSATLLASGKVLLAGGYASSAVLATAELYDPAAGAVGAFSYTGAMSNARARQVATLLPNGKVLVAGGVGASGSLGVADLYDPASGSFAPTGTMIGKRTWPSASLLPSGQVLVTGGEQDGVGLFSAELYDLQSGGFSATASMTVQRTHHTSTVLPNGKVFVTGGPFSTVVDVFDPVGAAAGSFVPAGATADARRYATVTALPSGKVLLAGGETSAGPLASVEIYDPIAKTYTATASMAEPRSQHTATLLGSGKVLIAGGVTTGGTQLDDAELFDDTAGGGAGAFTPTGTMTMARMDHTATLLPTGEVLMVGGLTSGTAIVSSAELYDPTTGSFAATGGMAAKRFGHAATLLRSGKVLVTAGITGNLTAELYDRSANAGAGAFSPTGNLTRGRFQHTATLLPSGKVLIVGGADGATLLSSAELYDPATGGFVQTGSMSTVRTEHTATMLPKGEVLVVGGEGIATLNSVEWFDPGDGANGGFHPGGDLGQSRSDHAATLLSDGSVFVAGGVSSGTFLSSAEVWTGGGLGSPSWRPVLASVPPSVVAGQPAAIAGSAFTGVSQASSGVSQSSDSNYPIAVWLPSVGGWGTVGRVAPWTATSATWTPEPSALAGPGWLFLVTNGIVGAAKATTVLPAKAATHCATGVECETGFCVDGVCCDSSCKLPCEACSAALKGSGADGVCGPIAQGTDPKDQCPLAPAVTCGTTGECDGVGSCALYAANTVCFPASCSGPVLSPAFVCDGGGTCQASNPVSCSPGLCLGQGASAACASACSVATDCAPGSFCKNGTCVAPQAPGAPCSAPSECLSGACVDGVCCNSSCDQVCSACTSDKTGAADGICAPIADGTDPDDECAAEVASGCGRDGFCNGAFACRLYAKDTPCGQSSCIDGLDHSAEFQAFCDGKGTCGAPVQLACGNYACDKNACASGCTTDAQCAPLFRCNSAGVCVPRGDSICVSDGESQSPDGTKQSCSPFRCNPSSGLCRTTCGSVADCLPGYDCDSAGRCGKPFPSPQLEGCGCAVPGERGPGGGPLLAALGLGLFSLARRRPGAQK
jgi:Galactose oxidase, central domain